MDLKTKEPLPWGGSLFLCRINEEIATVCQAMVRGLRRPFYKHRSRAAWQEFDFQLYHRSINESVYFHFRESIFSVSVCQSDYEAYTLV